MLLNLFQVRLRAKDVPDGHVAEGTVWAEPEEIHPGDEFQVSVEVRFPEGGAPGSIERTSEERMRALSRLHRRLHSAHVRRPGGHRRGDGS